MVGIFVMQELGIEEIFTRSSGPGGQNVNKVATCVILKHVPTGTVVKCQEFRTQHQNRIRARELLSLELQRCQRRKDEALRQAREKKRRQTRGRSRSGKERMLENKRKTAQKKRDRGKVLL